MIIAVLADLSGTVGSGVSVVGASFAALLTSSRAAGTLNLACVAGVVASLVGITSFAFVCLSLSCVVSRGFVATTFSSALVVVAEAGAPPEAFANFNSFSLSLLLTVVVAASVTDLPLLSSI